MTIIIIIIEVGNTIVRTDRGPHSGEKILLRISRTFLLLSCLVSRFDSDWQDQTTRHDGGRAWEACRSPIASERYASLP